MGVKAEFFCLLVLGPLVILGYSLYFAFDTFKVYRKSDLFELQLSQLNAASLFIGKTKLADLPLRIKELRKQEGFENLLVTDKTGVIRDANQPTWVGQSISSAFKDIDPARIFDPSSVEGSLEMGSRLISFLAIDLETDRIYVLLIGDKNSVLRILNIFIYKSAATLCGLLAFLFLASQFVSSRWILGLKHLELAIDRLGAGDWNVMVPLSGEDEFGEVFRKFDRMREALRKSVNSTANAKKTDPV
jgi:methyl-accepting chemotaxis protein